MKDFLIPWGKGLQNFEDDHNVYIHELCDWHTERWNKKFADGEATADNVLSMTREQVAHFKFIREVLTAVDQELRGATRTAQHSIPALVQIAGKTA
jgi:hypothetical protein